MADTQHSISTRQCFSKNGLGIPMERRRGLVPNDNPDVTRILHRLRAGDPGAEGDLWPVVYSELRIVAERQLQKEYGGGSINATALVHEAFLRLVDPQAIEWRDRAHFFGIAARAMRQTLVDQARRRLADKRGGGQIPVSLSQVDLGIEIPLEDLVALDEALDRLDQMSPRLRQMVEYRFFGGMTEAEVAGLLGVTERTVQRDWARARAWLYKELYPNG
jgi:RNA polymerase sigma factor (TIGR02999 family)